MRGRETTIARDGGIAIQGVFCISDDGHETTVEENEVPQNLVQARPALPHPGYRAVREELNAAQKARGFFGPRGGASGSEQGPRMKRSSIEQLKLRTRCARCRKLGHWAQQMKQWSKLIAEYGLQVEWSQERPEPASVIGFAT